MTKKIIITTLGIFILAQALPVFAESINTSTVRGEVKNEIKNTTNNGTNSQNRIDLFKTKADAEIARRINSLNELVTRINDLKKLSDASKASFSSEVQNEINQLNTLKTKIDADTDLVTLRTDQKSIFNEYRIYMLYIPQIRILASADRLNASIDLMNQVSTKIETRINGNVNLQNILNDANAKLSDATTQAANATNLVVSLTPDGGDATKVEANRNAMQSARTDLQTGLKDLQTARQDFQKIVEALKKQSPTPTATP